MIRQILAALLSLLLFLITYRYHQKLSKLYVPDIHPQYDYHSIRFNENWGNAFSPQTNNSSIIFTVKNQSREIITEIDEQKEILNFDNLGIDEIDAHYIKKITRIDDQETKYYIIQSDFYDIIYHTGSKQVCYERFGDKINEQKFFVSDNRLWVATITNSHNVMILRVYNCLNQNPNKLQISQKIHLPSKVISIKKIIALNQSFNLIQCIAFSRDRIQYTFSDQTVKLYNRQIIQASRSYSSSRQIDDMVVKVSEIVKQLEISRSFDRFIEQISLGYFKGKQQLSTKYRQQQQLFDIEFLDTYNNVVGKIKTAENSISFVSVNQKLLPFRTPIFLSEKDYNNMPNMQDLLENITMYEKKAFNLQVYQIKTNNIFDMKNIIGVYQPAPDSDTSFIAINQKMLNFYPHQNLKSQNFCFTRVQKGGIVFKGNKIQGIYDTVPTIDDYSSNTLKYGRSQNQTYQELTASGIEVLPGIYEAHNIYRSLFIIPKNNRVELIQGLSGTSLLNHYISKKLDYKLTGTFLQNNQLWVFQHHQHLEKPPIITKYQLFFNASSYRNILSIKRIYNLDIQGKILSVQKCIDTFYYFESLFQDKYSITRIHQAKMTNRQPTPDNKYSGTFQKMMILKTIQKNTKYLLDQLQEYPLTIEFEIGKEISENWKKMQLKHQYKILPYRVYYCPLQGQYYFFNIRKLMNNGYDMQVPLIQHEFLTYGLYILLALLGTTFFSLFIKPKTSNLNKKQIEESRQKEVKNKYPSIYEPKKVK